uniref:Uncharacterized protein n=1 Tax=Sinocyclocheilus grahami TaxID=75366 RepID=A0A672N8B2_SINGR
MPMMIAGSSSPCLLMSLSALGVTDTAEKNKEHSAKIFQFLKGELGLSDDRVDKQFGSTVCVSWFKKKRRTLTFLAHK